MKIRLLLISSVAIALLALALLNNERADLAPGQVSPPTTLTGPMARAATPASPSAVTPAPAQALTLDVHVEANASGEGSAHVVAASQGGQALAHIDTKGQANGRAVANAPVLNSSSATGHTDSGRLPVDAVPTVVDGLVTPVATEQVVILGDVVNLRAGPGQASAILGVARGGERWPLTGRSVDRGWWRVCCVDGLPAWVSSAYATLQPAQGQGDAVGVATALPVVIGPLVVPTELATVAPLSAPSATPLPFALELMAQHSEANSAVVYGWVHDAGGVSLENYSLQITKNGEAVDFGALSRAAGGTVRTTGYRQGTTRPGTPGAAEDQPYNFKLAFDPQVVGQGFDPVGAWSVQLIDAQGRPAGPAALFTLRVADPFMEMYVSYVRE